MATAQDVIDRARQLINDVASNFVSGLRWSDTELLQWLSDGQREIVQLQPESNMITDIFAVQGGFPRQRLNPMHAYRLIRVEANGMGAAGGAVVPPEITSIANAPGGGLDINWSSAEFEDDTVASYEVYGLDAFSFNGSWQFEPGQPTHADLPLVATVNGSSLSCRHSAAPSDEVYQSAYWIRAIATNSGATSDSAIGYSSSPS